MINVPRLGRSSTDNLVLVESHIQDAFFKMSNICNRPTSLEKAYDMAWQGGILNTSKLWCVNGNILVFIQNILRKRYSRMHVGTIKKWCPSG